MSKAQIQSWMFLGLVGAMLALFAVDMVSDLTVDLADRMFVKVTD